jgi:hypothetical protein
MNAPERKGWIVPLIVCLACTLSGFLVGLYVGAIIMGG